MPAGLAEVVVGGFVLVEVEFEFEGESEVGSGEAVAAETEAGGGGAQEVLCGEEEMVGGGVGLEEEQEDGGAEPAGGLGSLSHSQEYLADVVVEPWPPHIILIFLRLCIYFQRLFQTPLSLLLLPPPKPHLRRHPQTLRFCFPISHLISLLISLHLIPLHLISHLPQTLLLPPQPIQTQHPLKEHLPPPGPLHHLEAPQSQLGLLLFEKPPAELDAGGRVSVGALERQAVAEAEQVLGFWEETVLAE